jgi:hypothetical protein
MCDGSALVSAASLPGFDHPARDLIALKLRQRRPHRATDGISTRWWFGGRRMHLWRAEIFDMLVQRRRDASATLRLMRKLLKKQCSRRNAGCRQAALLCLGIPASSADLSS